MRAVRLLSRWIGMIGWMLVACSCGGAASQPANVEAGTPNKTALDGGPCTIALSNYDQSCAVDTDCVAVLAGDYCSGGCACAEPGAINVSGLAAFDAAIAKTPVGSGAASASVCSCPEIVGPCCRQGQCLWDCSAAPSDTLPACADAGGQCFFEVTSCADMWHYGTPDQGGGPANSCAYADETCCLLPSPSPQ